MKLEVKVRDGKGKGFSRRMRENKEIPGIIYGKTTEATPIFFKENEFKRFMNENHGKPVMAIDMNGEEKMVIIKEKQERPWKNQVMHVDFQEIHMGEKVHLTVPVHFIGAENLEKKAGIFVKNLHELEIECMVKDIPEAFVVDVSEMELNHSIHIRDMDISEDIRVFEDEGRTVCTMTMPRAIVEETAEAEAEGEGLEGEEGAESASEEGSEEETE